ncbi:hypothetical protein HGG76_05905 [Ochrobactrum tritici]|uniref:Uncharacterized protein n=1 Tax=Brucella tritici TaxID=94626 RepID=A0A7X6FRN5_9HYPH|nr:hypothetical protein [Brucella tritici]
MEIQPNPAFVRHLGYETRELCDRSQAVELLAAEIRRERDIAAKQLSEVVDRMSDDYLALKADNAAQAARIKHEDPIIEELEDANRELLQEIGKVRARRDTLEAKLAAAEKALEPFAAHAKERVVEATEWRDADTVQIIVRIGELREARAILGAQKHEGARLEPAPANPDGSRYEEPRFFYRGSERRLIQFGLIRSEYIAGIGADFTKLTITEAGREVLRKQA